MTEPTPTTGVEPLTEAEQKKLNELTDKRDRAAAAETEKARAEKLASLASADAVIKLLRNDKLNAAFDAAMNDPVLPFDTKSKIQGVRSSLDYNLGSIQQEIDAVSGAKA